MRISTYILLLLIFFVLATVHTDGRREQDRQIYISSLSIQFDKTDAIFIIDFDFDKFSKTYLLIFGSNTLEPKIRSIFSNFEYDIIKIDQEKAILRVKNISRLKNGFYLHDAHKFGETIDTIYISDPSSIRKREYYNMNSTPYYFYRS